MMIGTTPSSKDRAEMWQTWAAAAQKGDKEAYSSLLRDILPFIHSVLRPGLANPDWADDIAQEVLISIHKSLHTYSHQRAFKPWMLAIIHYRKTDFLRKHYGSNQNKQSSLDVLLYKIENNVTISDHIGELKDIERAIEVLPEKQRQIFKLMKVEGYTSKEVAKRMGMSVSAVKVSVHRAIKRLKSELQ